MPRAGQRCSLTCPNLKDKCELHKPAKEAWAGSKRKESGFLNSAEWARQRRRIIYREGGKCQYCGASDARHVDHAMPVWYTKVEQVEDEQLQLLCKECHGKKSSFEGVQAKKIRKLDGLV